MGLPWDSAEAPTNMKCSNIFLETSEAEADDAADDDSLEWDLEEEREEELLLVLNV